MAVDTIAPLVGVAAPGDANAKSMFSFEISKTMGDDFAPIANDFMRMLCIQLAIQVLVASNTDGIFTGEFFLLLLYIAIGVVLYWAVVRKLVIFK